MEDITQEDKTHNRIRVLLVDDSDASGEILQKAELDVVDDGPGKPIQIWNVIGRRPILAAGNSNGDLQMMKFAGGPSSPALRLFEPLVNCQSPGLFSDHRWRQRSTERCTGSSG